MSGRQLTVDSFSSNADFFSREYIVYMLKRTLAVLALVAVSLAVCPANYQIANLQAGTNSLTQAPLPSQSITRGLCHLRATPSSSIVPS